MLGEGHIRWFSMKSRVDRILEQYDVLTHCSTSAVFKDSTYTNDSILNFEDYEF